MEGPAYNEIKDASLIILNLNNYLVEDFINKAKEILAAKGDLMKVAHLLWFSTFSSIKLVFLQIGVNLGSDKSIDVFGDLANECVKDADEREYMELCFILAGRYTVR
uniref:Uncharacterized protein n=1 Tax=Panagrolaimus superbus TaxID=310955 RepID=A0A914Z9G6_9BILA